MNFVEVALLLCLLFAYLRGVSDCLIGDPRQRRVRRNTKRRAQERIARYKRIAAAPTPTDDGDNK